MAREDKNTDLHIAPEFADITNKLEQRILSKELQIAFAEGHGITIPHDPRTEYHSNGEDLIIKADWELNPSIHL